MEQPKCALCEGEARMYCKCDDAMLCWDCDACVHGANFLVARHTRALLCRSCRSPTTWKASGSRLTPTISLCDHCCNLGHHLQLEDEDEEDDENENKKQEEEEEEDNQVVPPIAVTIAPPVPSSSSSDGSTLKGVSIAGRHLRLRRKRKRSTALILSHASVSAAGNRQKPAFLSTAVAGEPSPH